MKSKSAFASMWFFVIVIVTGSLVAIVYKNEAKHEQYRNKISVLTTELSRHQPDQQDLHRLLNESRFRGLTLREDSPNEWVVETPTQFGAKNWVLYIEVRGSKAAALRVRTADSKTVHPDGAPPDKGLGD